MGDTLKFIGMVGFPTLLLIKLFLQRHRGLTLWCLCLLLMLVSSVENLIKDNFFSLYIEAIMSIPFYELHHINKLI